MQQQQQQHNLARLTQSHLAVAAKKKAKKEQIKQVFFDEDARRDFLTGFHKRKLAKADAARKKAMERDKLQRQETRREQRRMLRQQAIENAAHVESAYHTMFTLSDNGSESEWSGISSAGKRKQKEEEYEDDEITATVTVVEDFDPDTLIHGPLITEAAALPSGVQQTLPQLSASRDHRTSKKKTRTKIRYETKGERKAEQTKQRARRTEKAELAGGKASRKKGVSRRKRK